MGQIRPYQLTVKGLRAVEAMRAERATTMPDIAPLTAERLAAIRKRAEDGLAYRSYWYDSPRYSGAVFAGVSSALTVLHDDVPELLAELEQAREHLDAVRALHRADNYQAGVKGCRACSDCCDTLIQWPCATIRALDVAPAAPCICGLYPTAVVTSRSAVNPGCPVHGTLVVPVVAEATQAEPVEYLSVDGVPYKLVSPEGNYRRMTTQPEPFRIDQPLYRFDPAGIAITRDLAERMAAGLPADEPTPEQRARFDAAPDAVPAAASDGPVA